MSLRRREQQDAHEFYSGCIDAVATDTARAIKAVAASLPQRLSFTLPLKLFALSPSARPSRHLPRVVNALASQLLALARPSPSCVCDLVRASGFERCFQRDATRAGATNRAARPAPVLAARLRVPVHARTHMLKVIACALKGTERKHVPRMCFRV